MMRTSTFHQLARILVQEADHTLAHAPLLVQDLRHRPQGPAQVERTAQHRAHLEQRGELGLEQILLTQDVAAATPVTLCRHEGPRAVMRPP